MEFGALPGVTPPRSPGPPLGRLRTAAQRIGWGWGTVMLVCVGVLALWLPDLTLPLGNSDDGRILARFGLQARNFWELGPIESRFGAVIEPFVRDEYGVAPRTAPPTAAVTYAHHPPLPIFVAVASVGLLGDTVAALRIVPFVMGAATVAAMALLLRVQRVSWGPTLLAVTAMVCTGFFYVYGRIGVGYSLLVASTAVVAWLRAQSEPPRWALAVMACLAAGAAMQSWIALVTLGLLAPWLFTGTLARQRPTPPSHPEQGCTPKSATTVGRRHSTPVSHPEQGCTQPGATARLAALVSRGWSPALTAMLVGAAVGAAVTVGWLLNATDLAELSERVSFRVGRDVDTAVETTSFTFSEFLSRQWRFAGHELLAPPWLRALLVPALVAGIADRRTRVPVLVTLAAAATLTFGFQQGAWIHRLWNFPWLAPATIGLAALADAVRRLLASRAPGLRLPLGVLAALGAVSTLVLVIAGGTRDYYLSDPAEAGAVLEEARGEASPEVVWTTPGISTPRWVSYYLDAPVFALDQDRLVEVLPSDLVLVRTDRTPDYFPDDALRHALVSQGDYHLISADRLLALTASTAADTEMPP